MKRATLESNNEVSEELARLRARRRIETEDDEDLSDYMTMAIPEATKMHRGPRGNPSPDRKLSRRERAALVQEQMAKSRIEGSSKPLDEANKGFKMLQKFGYSGGGLGREGKGVEEPIIVPERDPGTSVGIGVEAMLADKLAAEYKRVADMKLHQEQALKNFISSQANKHVNEKLAKTLRKAQGIIRNLDERECVPAHSLWGPRDRYDEEDDDGSSAEENR